MVSPASLMAHALGLGSSPPASTTPLDLIACVEEGLPVAAVDRMAKTVAPGDAEFKHRFISKATLARRKRDRSARLTIEEGGRLARIAGVWTHAVEVWKSDESARAFLFRAHPLLNGRRPIDVALSTSLGADLVDAILGGLEHGVAV